MNNDENEFYQLSEPLTDSRALADPKTALFFALKTKNDDGHRYIRGLYDRGVRRFVICNDFDTNDYPDASFLKVADPLAELQRVASLRRNNFSNHVIGITGSRGKTIVKEWLYELLSPERKIVRSPRSYNSQIGVPMSIWGMDSTCDIAIFEAGISRIGEMQRLNKIIRPTITILTNVLTDHDAGFASRDEKIREKLQLADGSGTLIYNASDPDIARIVTTVFNGHRIGWSIADGNAVENSQLTICNISRNTESTTFSYVYAPTRQTGKITIPFTLEKDIENAIDCLATLLVLDIEPQEIASRMKRLTPVGTRLQVSEGVNNCMIIHDDYTCDLHSLAPALDFASRRRTAGLSMTVILSDIDSESLPAADTYKAIARLMKLRGVSRLIGIGTDISAHATEFPRNSRFFESTTQMLAEMSTSDFDSEMMLIKGAPRFQFDRIVHQLEARTHETVLEVNLDAMISNYNFFRSHLHPSTGIVAMVKASGYGAGSYELAKSLQAQGAAYLAVAVLDEGIDLRNAGITMPIMVMNPKVINYRQLFANQLEPEIFSFGILNEIIAEAKKCGITDYPVHIKLDTGMHRLGFLEEDLPQLIEALSKQNSVRVCSVFSHLATADCLDMDDYTRMQLDYFERCSKRIVDAFPYRIMRHILNTAGIIRYPEYQYDMVRLGIGLYGIPVINDGSEAGLRPVSTLRSVIIAIKKWDSGTTIGYSRRGTVTKQDTLIATIPIGYADGVNRHTGCGNWEFLVNGVRCPTVGNICMDLCMIDVTDANASVGDTVEIFGTENPVTELATRLNTIPYEMLTSVSPRVRRIYYRES